MVDAYDPSKIESKWQRRWKEAKIYQPDMLRAERPYFNLMMFPYPSAEGLHVGNMYAFTGADIHGRFRRMQGYDVFQPIGLDGFGIHSENYAIKIGRHPAGLTRINEARFYGQLRKIGSGFAWDHRLETYDPAYYRWTQWIFIKLYTRGLAYRKSAPVNWCPTCATVLADEQVAAGSCERCETPVTTKELEQWFFKITAYADRLLTNLDRLDWPTRVKLAQRRWIGRREGAEIVFATPRGPLWVFTTRPDTLCGATFIAIAPSHPWALPFATRDSRAAVATYIERARSKASAGDHEAKRGVLTGTFAVNPINGAQVPIYVADYVLAEYGTGAVIGVPAHDERDFAFATINRLPIVEVVTPAGRPQRKLTQAFVEDGILVESGPYTGMASAEARTMIVTDLTARQLARTRTAYHLRDWLISRQRYWGPPIPMVYCERHGWQPVQERELPVVLPPTEDYLPRGDSRPPLARVDAFVRTTCPIGGEPAVRATEVSDTFLDSAWYYLRYPCVNEADEPWNSELVRRWLPVDMYIGGAEHSVLHLLYSRFLTMVFHDWGMLDFDEPFNRFRAHGLLIKEGAKMSKSRGNLVTPDNYIGAYGADTLRTYLMFIGPYEQSGDFQDKGIAGITRFLRRVWQSCEAVTPEAEIDAPAMHRTIQKVTEDLEHLRYNTAIAAMMEYVNELSAKGAVSTFEYATLLQLLAPFAPHITEELWERLGNRFSIHTSPWPSADPAYLTRDRIALVVQVNGRVRDRVDVDAGSTRSEIERIVLGRQTIRTWLGGGTPKRIVYVPGKLINLVL